MSVELKQLLYRGNFSLSLGIEYEGVILSANYPFGYREDAVIGAPLRLWQLNYTALHKRVNVQLPNGERASRLNYVWGVYCESKDNGNRPFILRCPRDDKFYLAYFPENNLQIQMVDSYLATAGLPIKQLRIKSVATNADGSLDEDDLPVTIG
jgi:hypothetical protein